MANEWRCVTIGELCDAGVIELQTGPFGTQLHSYDYVEDGIPIVPTEAIRDRQIDHSVLPKISPAKAAELARHRLQSGDILFARRGVRATGHIGCVREAEVGFLCGTGAIRLRVGSGVGPINPDFLSHILANPASVEWFKFHAIGATMPNLNEGIIRSFPLQFPPLDEQRAIASILGAFDDKIELNRYMNETIEAMARALFQSWFVDFDPVHAKAQGLDPGLLEHVADLLPGSFEDSELGKIPKQWRIRRMGDALRLSREALDPSRYPDETFNHFSIPAFDAGRIPAQDPGESIKSQKLAVVPGCILVSKLNPDNPRVWMPGTAPIRPQVERRQVASTEFLVCVGDATKAMSRELMYCLASSAQMGEHLATHATGTSNSHQRVRPQDFLDFRWVEPPIPVREAFTEFVKPLFDRAANATYQSATLAAVRDTLLPKLISGELRVKDAEFFLKDPL